MVYSPKRRFGRFVLAACAVSLGVASLGAQTPSTAAPVGANPSRFDLFTGYSYFGAHGQLKPLGVNYSSVDLGAIGSGAYYFNKYFGGEMIFVDPSGRQERWTVDCVGRSDLPRPHAEFHSVRSRSRWRWQTGWSKLLPFFPVPQPLDLGNGSHRRWRYGLRSAVYGSPLLLPSLPG